MASSTPWLARAISAGVSHLQSFPHECLCLHPSSVEFGPARWSQRTSLLSQSSGIAIELRERSRRQAFCLEIKLNVTQIALPLALVAIPRWDAIPRVFFLTHVAVLSVLHCTHLAGSATSCCAARFFTRRSRSVYSEHPVSERCLRSAAAHPRDLSAAVQRPGSELPCSGWQFLSSTTLDDCRKSTTPNLAR